MAILDPVRRSTGANIGTRSSPANVGLIRRLDAETVGARATPVAQRKFRGEALTEAPHNDPLRREPEHDCKTRIAHESTSQDLNALKRPPSIWTGTAIELIAVIGTVHLITAPDQFNDTTYEGVLFLANAAGAAVTAIGLRRGERRAWPLGLLVAGGALIDYVVSRTVGLPGLPVDPEVFKSLAVVSVIAEAGFIAVAVQALRQQRQFSNRRNPKGISNVS